MTCVCVFLDVRVNFSGDTEAALLCDRGCNKTQWTAWCCCDSWCWCNCVVLCRISSHIQVHANVSFQSPACPSLPSTWETATAFTLTRDRQGEMFLQVKTVRNMKCDFKKRLFFGVAFSSVFPGDFSQDCIPLET